LASITDLLARLAAIDTCALSDALDKLGLAGQVTGLRRESGSTRVAGVAVTVKLGTGAPPPGAATHLGTKAIEAADDATIIVIEQRTGVEAGCWGGLLTRGAILAGVRAVRQVRRLVKIGNVTVSPGDYLVADGSAVVVILPEQADAVLAVAEAIVAREALMIAEIGKNTRMSEVLGGNYEQMLEKDQ
jgi:4-hydroxy-4-methyl-2-oxoglutarate aldolase